ncbi:MAG: hypothetical protein NC401_20085, partial [Ruminococcus sp.]|nr:hypothetical protein [Ruminococcus sp.]
PEKRGSVINDSTLYVSSGFEMTVRKTAGGYELKELTVNGSPLDEDKTYSVTVIGNLTMMLLDALDAVGAADRTDSGKDFKQLVTDRLINGQKLAEPSDYITLTE